MYVSSGKSRPGGKEMLQQRTSRSQRNGTTKTQLLAGTVQSVQQQRSGSAALNNSSRSDNDRRQQQRSSRTPVGADVGGGGLRGGGGGGYKSRLINVSVMI